MGKHQMFNRGDRMIGGMMNKPPKWRRHHRIGRSTSRA